MVHAEDGDLVEYSTRAIENPQYQSLAAWESSRPIEAEGNAVLRALYMAQYEHCKVTIVHVSSNQAVKARQMVDYVNARLETCPHYLVLAVENDLGPIGKVAPPVRHRSENDALWTAIGHHQIDFLGSDHNVWLKAAKKELWSAKAGLPGIGLLLPIFATAARTRGLSWPDIAYMTSVNAAKWFGLFPQKGSIRVGSDADLVIMESGEKIVPASDPFSVVDYSPYSGFKLSTWPWATIVNGNLVYVKDKFVTDSLAGRVLNQAYSTI